MNVDLLEEYPELPIGWHDLFECMCEELFVYIREHKYPDVKIIAAKEKYGEMRLVVDIESYSDEVTDQILHKWCEISRNVCVSCGEINTRRTTGYIVPICKNCWGKALHKDKDLFEKHTAPALGYAQKYPMEFEKLQKMKWRHR